uniref:Rho-GAP domain-containing protein n=1 Tax=Opuntia streptacantha TaxID=393608 RepID=A0A7C9CRF2_OPUST
MSSMISPQWQDKASGFLSTSGVKLKEAGHSAGTFVEEVAKDAKENVVDMAERVGSVFKSKWSFFQQPATKQAMQERLVSAAASTSFFLRKGFSETKDKVAIGKTKVEQVAKKTAQRSKSILSDIERRQKGIASTDVFGVAIEVTVQRQQCSRSIPHILVRCADYLIASGLGSPYVFKVEGDKKAIQQLVTLYNQEPNALLPEGTNPLDVAALIKCYLASLPEPVATIELYEDLRSARSSINVLRNVLKRLPTVNYMTLEFVTALLLRVSQKSVLNKMDAQSLSEQMAPVIIWQAGRRPESYRQFWHHDSNSLTKNKSASTPTYTPWDLLEDGEDEDEDASSPIPLDDGLPIDYAAVEVIRCLIEHHNAIFTDANETVWR